MRFRLRTLLIALAVICVALATIREAAKYIKPSISYQFRAQFTQLPADDTALEKWLSQQPGVVRVGINREPSGIEVIWIMSRDLAGSPPIPDCRQQFERFGYKGLQGYQLR